MLGKGTDSKYKQRGQKVNILKKEFSKTTSEEGKCKETVIGWCDLAFNGSELSAKLMSQEAAKNSDTCVTQW